MSRLAVSRLALVCLVAPLLSLTAGLTSPATAVTAAPVGLSTSGASADIPTLSWSRVPEATSYDVQVSASSSFAGNPLWSTNTVNVNAVPDRQLSNGQLWFRVRANGPTGASAWASHQFVRTQNSGPSLLSPADGAVLVQPQDPVLLSWSPVAGAKEYSIEISSDSGFTDPSLITTYKTKTTTLVRPDSQAARPYYWRVAGVLDSGITTRWSVQRSYVLSSLPEAELVSPANDATVTVDDVVLDWKPVPGATSYDVEISLVPDFTTIVHQQQRVVGTRYSPPTTLDNNQYYWRVRARDVSGNLQDESAVPTWRFRRAWPEQPTLEYPANGQVVGDPFYFQWTPVKLASRYQLELKDSTGVSRTCVTTQTTWTPSDSSSCWPQAAGTYSWRVTALDDPAQPAVQTDPVSAPVHTFSYSPRLVQPKAPAIGASVSVPTLSWEPMSGASKYNVVLTNTANGQVTQQSTKATSFTPRSKLPEGSYRWYVQSVSEDNRVGPALQPGDQWTFNLTAAPIPTATNPEPSPALTGTYGRFPTLTWTPVAGATHYKILVRPPGAISDIVLNPSFQYPAGEDETERFVQQGVYGWRVEAWNGSIYLSRSSGFGQFTIAERPAVTGQRLSLTGTETDTPATSCALTIPDSCEGVRQNPVLRWDPEPDTAYYQLYLSYDRELTNLVGKNDGFQIRFPITVQGTMYIPPVALPEGDAGTAYFWGVQPCSTTGVCRHLEYPQHSFSKLSNKVVPISPGIPLDQAGTTAVPSLPDDITFTWQDYLATNTAASTAGATLKSPSRSEAKSYRIQVSDDPQFNNLLDNQVVDQTTFTSFVNTYPDTQLYWRVQAIDGSGNPLPWSAKWTFDKQSPVPQLVGPSGDNNFDGSEPLRWQPLGYASAYDVEIYRNGDTKPDATNLVDKATTAQTAVSWLTPVEQSAEPYTWRVRRVDAKNRRGDWSAWKSYSVVARPVQLDAPADGSRVPPNESLFSWQPVNQAASYRWERRPAGGSQITSITTAATAYAPTSTIQDSDYEWRVVALDTAGKELGQSEWRGFSVFGAPVALTPARIEAGTSSGQVGSTLTGVDPTWDLPGVTNLYQWLRDGNPIANATASTYEVTGADLSRLISLRVTGRLPGYRDAVTTSNGITAVSGPAPTTATSPSITGTGQVSSTLTATPPTWNEPGVTMTYQWLRDGVAVNSPTPTTYVVQANDADHDLSLRVTGKKQGYADAVVTSNVIRGVLGPASECDESPTISGSGLVGTTLTVDRGTWSPPPAGYAYQWLREGAPINGAVNSYYQVTAADAGRHISVEVIASRAGFEDGQEQSASLSIRKLASATSATLASAKIRKASHGKMKVVVTAQGVSSPTGKVTVLKGTRALATGTLTRAKLGRITVTLPRLSVGKHRLRVKYNGNQQLSSSKSAYRTLTVTRR
jgi:large repetitive protein